MWSTIPLFPSMIMAIFAMDFYKEKKEWQAWEIRPIKQMSAVIITACQLSEFHQSVEITHMLKASGIP